MLKTLYDFSDIFSKFPKVEAFWLSILFYKPVKTFFKDSWMIKKCLLSIQSRHVEIIVWYSCFLKDCLGH